MELALAATLTTSVSQVGYVLAWADTISFCKGAVQIQISRLQAALKYVVSLPYYRVYISHSGAIQISRLG
jgi:hypothetical protein